jgi:tetratricopeptide (TPR) repeat protein
MRATTRLCVTFGAALVAFSLCGSTWRPIIRAESSPAEIALHDEAVRLYMAGEFTRAGEVFRVAADRAEREGAMRRAAVNWNNAGGSSLARLDYRTALPDFLKAKQTAEKYGLTAAFRMTMSNLADLYLEMGHPAGAMRIAREGLAAEGGDSDTDATSKLRFHVATALARLHRFDEAEPIYRQALEESGGQGDPQSIARMLGNFGSECLEAGRLEEAEAVLDESLRVAWLHRMTTSANILRALAKLRAKQGDARSAAALFEAAIQAPPGITPQWMIYTDRAEFRLGRNNLEGAMADFREARRIAGQMRADIVPADRDRVVLEGGLSRSMSGLIEAGNRLAIADSNNALLQETFDAAEQDRRWSLRALDSAANDWRNRLPGRYWDLLARYQAAERSMMAKSTPELVHNASVMELDLEAMEAAGGSAFVPEIRGTEESAFARARRFLEPGVVLWSFHVSASSGWLWAVDRRGVSVYPIPAAGVLKEAVEDFGEAVQRGDSEAVALGRHLYGLLFGGAAERFTSAKQWLLELDGPLFDLPFAALVTDVGDRKNGPNFLFEHAVLETIPGALMLERATPFGDGEFLGVGDPIYNAADERYEGRRKNSTLVLPRLAGTGAELEACARAWNPARARILKGAEAGLMPVREALRSNPAVIHFATHVVKGPGDHSSGLIALSLDRSGEMGFLGPTEIVAHKISPSLIVLNGCHSAQGDALPGTGLMGLTRAWIGAGARAVLATRWDILDDPGAAMMVGFYRALRADPRRGPAHALRQAQLEYLKSEESTGNIPVKALAVGAAYFLLGRG